MKSGGKCVDFIFGIKGEGDDATSEVQAMRYPVKSWTADAARAHCKGKKGSFEAAAKPKEKSDMGDELRYRSIEIRAAGSGAPSTFDREKRTVDVTLSTEEPVMVWGEREVLLAEGAQIPKGKKIPMLDAHNRFTFDGILGSFKGIHKSNGEVLATAHFSKREKAEDAFTLIEEGHLTDVSVGYKVNKYVRIADKESQMIKGREFKGPMVVVTNWTLREGSVAPVGADINAKVRASERENQGREDEKMDERMRHYLISRGLPEDATEDEAYKFLGRLEAEDKKRIEKPPASQPADPPKDKEVDEAKVREEGILTERTRVAEITGLGQRLGNAELAQRCIDDGISIEDAMRKFVDWKATQEQETVRTNVQRDERDKFRSAALDSILLRTNVEVENPAPGAEDLRGFSLRELARESLRVAGLKTSGQPMEMIGRALTTSDFPLILADSARKSLFVGFDTAPESWSQWCATGSVSDFKTHSSVRASEFDDLLEVPEHGEFVHGGRTEAQEQYYVATYGRLFAITRQTIINDDLNALSDVPRGHGEAAARKVADIAWAVLTANAAMGDGVALFDGTDHGNVGTTGIISETTIGEAVKLMALQTDLAGKRRLNIRAEYLLAPVALMVGAEIFFESEMYSGADATSFRKNIFAGKFTRIYEARLDDDDADAYYLAGPKGKTVTVFFLNGIQTPYLETQRGWTVDGVEYKVRIDAGAKAMDWRAMVYNAGA